MSRPEPRPLAWTWAGTALAVVGLVTVAGTPGTHGAWSDSDSVRLEAGAGVWAPDPPAACGPVDAYVEVVWGTPGRDVLVGDDSPRIFMGLEGDDVLNSPRAADCLVGGPGRDQLIGNPATIVVSGPGDSVEIHGSGRVEPTPGTTPTPGAEPSPGGSSPSKPPAGQPDADRPAPPAPPAPTPTTPTRPTKPAAPPRPAPPPASDPGQAPVDPVTSGSGTPPGAGAQDAGGSDPDPAD